MISIKFTLKVTSISVNTSSSIRGSSLSSSSSTVRTTSREETSTNAKTTRHLTFLP
jgi:phospholipase/lecithinase/hemolysin